VRDLRDGESVEVQGSASRPYQLKNVAGVYSCTCPAWRNQSLPIDRRSCKHLRRLRGDQAEETRVGQSLPKTPEKLRPAIIVPPLLLAEYWDGESEVRGWWFSELCGRPHNSLYVAASIMWRPALLPRRCREHFPRIAT
jgi:DNA ligase-1